MPDIFSRTRMLFGDDGMKKLAASRVAVFGAGGVGGFVIESLARSGVGAIDIVDKDTVDLTNINRQIIALHSTVGRYKADVAAERVLDINPACRVTAHRVFFLPETKDLFDFSEFSYVVDAVDTVTAKLTLAECAQAAGVPIISCMGTGNKLDPTRLEVADIYDTSVCPLARVIRTECRKRGIRSLTVVYSREPPFTAGAAAGAEPAEGGAPSPDGLPANGGSKCGCKQPPASAAFVPPAAGILVASVVTAALRRQ